MLNNKLSHEGTSRMRFGFALVFAAMATLAISAFSVNVNAATFVVNTTADTQDAAPGNGTCADSNGQCSLRAAITEANALAGADTITVPAGTYTQSLTAANENANAGGDFDITSPMTINGAGAGTTIIQANAAPNTSAERVIHVLAGGTAVTIDGVTIQNGKALNATDGGRGGGIKAGENAANDANINLTITNTTIQNNVAETRGGGLAINKGKLTMTGCTVTGNTAGLSATAGGAGGGILIDSQDNTTVAGQTADITNTVISNNVAETALTSSFGGGVIVRALNAVVTFDGCTVNGNRSTSTSTVSTDSGFAGGLYNQQAHMIVKNTTVSANISSRFHAGIRNLASTAAAATLDIINSRIINNTSAADDGQGGGITNILGSTFDATVNVDHSEISGNTLSGGASIGGGLINTGSAGGAALLQVTNSTVSGNSAADIGGIYSDGTAATCIVDFSTVANNHANNTTNPQGGGIFQDTTAGGSTFVSNTISADNVAGSDVDINELATSLDYNHFENPNPAFVGAAHDVLTGDPGLGALGNNGGNTQTQVPGAGSPVINTIPNGTNGCGSTITDDQRGLPRPFPAGGACDKGAVEAGQGGGATPTNTATATFTPTSTATNTATNTPTNTPTSGPTATSTNTFTPTSTATNTATQTSTPTNTPTSGPTATSTNTFTPTASATNTSTQTNTPTNTPTTAPSATPSCTPNNIILDGGFETGGIPSTIWNDPQTSTNFGTPLCDASCGNGGGASPPRTGSNWLWMGGIGEVETARLGQSVVIPAGTASLHFWMRIGTVSSPFTDVLNVKVDGAIVQSYPEPSTAESAYTERVIDMTAFANGASHNITFEYIGPTTGTGSYTIDDVSLLAGTGCSTSTPTSTPTATATATATATFTATPVMTPQTFANQTAVCTTLGTVADLYPSQITVAGGPTRTGNIRVTFNNFWHVFPDNFDALLVGPGGQKFVLMADAGGAIAVPQNAPVTLTLADFQPVVLPDSGPLVSGAFEPTNWETPVTSFPAPAPAAPYVEPGNTPLGPISTTMFGTFGLLDSNGVWSLYIRDDGGAFVNPTAVSGCLDGGWQIQFIPLTAAPSSVSGRVLTANGQGIRNAKVVVTGGNLSSPITVTTGSMGYYSIDGLATGQAYVLTVVSQRYTFSNPAQVISLVDNIADANFVADPTE